MSLISWYKLNGNAENSSVYGDDGTESNISWISGKLNDCASFNGTSSAIDISNFNLPSNWGERFSISAWIYVPTSATWSNGAMGNIIGRGAYAGSHGLVRSTTDNTIRAWIRGDSGSVAVNGTVSRDTWHHCVMTWSGNELKLYVDGSLQGSTTGSMTGIPDNTPLYLGRALAFSGSGGNWFEGYLDDVRIYNNVLSLNEVKELARGKAGHWKLNNSAEDSSGQGNDGTEVSTTYTTNSKIGSACYDNDGSARHINCGNTPNITHNQTICMWLYPYSNAVRRNPYNKAYGGEGTITHETNGTLNYYWGTNGGNGTPYQAINSSSALTLNQWSHIAVVRDLDSGRVKWYVNGVETNDVAASYSAAALTTANLLIGTGYTNHYNGRIDDVRVYATALSANDIEQIYKQRGSIDNFGNLIVPELVETGHKPLLMDYTVWEDGQTGSVTGFSGWSSYNRRILANDPWSKETVVWEAYSVSGSSAGGGIYATAQSIDNTKMYRMSWWEKRVSNSTATTARYYAGLNGYGSVNGVLRRDSGTNDTNPYFYNTSNIPTSAQLPEGEWVLVVGHVWPVGSGTGADHLDSGRYTLTEKLGGINRDYVWRDETTTARSRTLMIYQPDADGVVHYTVYPRLDVVDGTEPSIAELLAGFDSTSIDYIRSKGGTKHIAFDVNSKLTYTGDISEIGPSLGLVGWWPLNGNTEDLSGEGNDGTNNSATIVAGLNQLAYNFASTNQSIEVDNMLSSGDPHTVSMWVKPSSILANGNSSVRKTPFTGSGPIWSPGFWLTGNMIRVHAATEYRDYTINYDTTDWWHIGQVFDGTTCYTILNGTVVLGSRTAYSPANPTTFRIGNEAASSSYSWQGEIQDVRIYDRALSDEEVKTLYEITSGSDKTKMKKTSENLFVKGEFTED